ncbi:hypothetical protein HYX06_02320 [Candidatus Woesearchaeota archaeon]|nr:hypothetical protein [Candidatus Woesearchaeota archaeon]
MDSKEDDDISIDLGKLKNFFKKDKEEKNTEEAAKIVSKEDKSDAVKSDSDDDISLDLSKIKNLFKSEKKEEKEAHHEGRKREDDEDISFDFSKIKNIFRPEKKAAFDLDKAVYFFKKYGIVLLALIPIILSIYVRMQAGFLPVTDEWAANTIMNNLRSQVRSGIDQQYPNLPDANKNALADAELQKVILQNKAQIDEQIKQTSSYFKSFFQDDNGNNYMPDIDPYYWVRYAENILKSGHPGDILKDGKPFDSHQLAPVGRPVAFDQFHSYSLAYFYKILSFFSPELTLMRTSFYIPVFISAICVLIVFLIARKIAGNAAGFFAGMIMAVNGAFLGRTLFGHADNDGWVILFPLLATWLFVTAEDAKKPVIAVIMGSLAGFFTGVFTFAWSGWWFIFDFLLVTIAITVAYLVLINFNEIRKNKWFMVSDINIRNLFIFGIIYLLSTGIFATLFSGWLQFRNSFLGPLSFPSIKAPVITSSLWPNVLTTVAELNEGSINGIINSIGGPFLFFISLIGLILAISTKEGRLKKFDVLYLIASILFYGIYFLFRKSGFDISVLGLAGWIMLPLVIRVVIAIYKKDNDNDFKLPILLSLWIVSTIFASIKGIRFTLLLAPAFSVAFGVAFGRIYEYISGVLTKGLKIHKIIASGILIIVLLSVYVSPTRAAIRSAGSDMPIVNDAWYNTLISIKKDSKPDAIITSWWDFGHHFKAIADRPVTFDGTTQIHPPAHWVGKLLMTDNEKQAFGIIRMLDCGSNSAFSTLNKLINNPHISLKIINKIILMDKADAEKELGRHGLTKSQVDDVIKYTHCTPPEGYIIASEDMVGKSGVWSHFGSWNFEKADIWQNARKMPQEDAVNYMMGNFNYTRERAESTYFEIQAIGSDSEANSWIAPWPGYGGEITCRKNKEGLFVCSPLGVGNNVALVFNINLTNYEVYAKFQDKIFKPSSAAFVTEDGVFKKRFDDATTGHGMTIIPQGKDEVKAVISSNELAGSMFTRMFYMQGHGLKYFDLVNRQRGLTGTDIYTYKVDWEGRNATIVKEYADFFKEPAKEAENETSAAQSNLTEENATVSNSNNSQ